VYIDIQALQVSLLGGRIFFKGIRYHGNNETILLQSGYVTWSYWLRKVRELDISREQGLGNKRLSTESDRNNSSEDRYANTGRAEGGGFKITQHLPCRLSIVIKGAEWFVYNRSAAYDSIVAGLTKTDAYAEDIKVESSVELDTTEGLKKRFRHKNAKNTNRASKSDSQDSGKISNTPPLT